MDCERPRTSSLARSRQGCRGQTVSRSSARCQMRSALHSRSSLRAVHVVRDLCGAESLVGNTQASDMSEFYTHVQQSGASVLLAMPAASLGRRGS